MNSTNAHLYLPLVQALADGKTIQYSDRPDKEQFWTTTNDTVFAHPPDCYRIKPLAFPPKPEGMEWHNPDNLTAEQVGDGFRLMTTSEPTYQPHELWLVGSKRWESTMQAPGPSGVFGQTYRVPISTPFSDGSRIVDGKLVKPEPEKWAAEKAAHKAGKMIQWRVPGADGWMRVSNPIWEDALEYRIEPWTLTRHLPGFRPLRDGEEWANPDGWEERWLKANKPVRPLLRGEKYNPFDCVIWEKDHVSTFRPLPEPPKPVPLEPADWMKDGPWWVRSGEDDKCPAMVVSVNVHSVLYGRYSSSTHEEMMHCERSNDGITWFPCHKLP